MEIWMGCFALPGRFVASHTGVSAPNTTTVALGGLHGHQEFEGSGSLSGEAKMGPTLPRPLPLTTGTFLGASHQGLYSTSLEAKKKGSLLLPSKCPSYLSFPHQSWPLLRMLSLPAPSLLSSFISSCRSSSTGV